MNLCNNIIIAYIAPRKYIYSLAPPTKVCQLCSYRVLPKCLNNKCTGVQNPHCYMHNIIQHGSLCMILCMFNARSIELHYPEQGCGTIELHTLHLNRVLRSVGRGSVHCCPDPPLASASGTNAYMYNLHCFSIVFSEDLSVDHRQCAVFGRHDQMGVALIFFVHVCKARTSL